MLPTRPSALAFCSWPDPSCEAQSPAFFLSLNFQCMPVRSPIFWMPTFFAVSRLVLYIDSQSSSSTPSYNVGPNRPEAAPLFPINPRCVHADRSVPFVNLTETSAFFVVRLDELPESRHHLRSADLLDALLKFSFSCKFASNFNATIMSSQAPGGGACALNTPRVFWPAACGSGDSGKEKKVTEFFLPREGAALLQHVMHGQTFL